MNYDILDYLEYLFVNGYTLDENGNVVKLEKEKELVLTQKKDDSDE